MALSLTQTTVADELPEKVKKLMPKDQREALTTLQELTNRYQEAEKLTNRLARKEAIEKVKQEGKEFEKKLLVRGMKDWIAQIKIESRQISLACGDGKSSLVNRRIPSSPEEARRRVLFTNVTIEISLRSVSDKVKQSILKMEDGDLVAFSISPDEKTPFRVRVTVGRTGGRVSANGNGNILTAIRKQAVE